MMNVIISNPCIWEGNLVGATDILVATDVSNMLILSKQMLKIYWGKSI